MLSQFKKNLCVLAWDLGVIYRLKRATTNLKSLFRLLKRLPLFYLSRNSFNYNFERGLIKIYETPYFSDESFSRKTF